MVEGFFPCGGTLEYLFGFSGVKEHLSKLVPAHSVCVHPVSYYSSNISSSTVYRLPLELVRSEKVEGG